MMYLSEQHFRTNVFFKQIILHLYKYHRVATENLLSIEDFNNFKISLTKLFGEERYNIYYNQLLKYSNPKSTQNETEVDFFQIPIVHGLDKLSMQFLIEFNKFRIDNKICSSNLFEMPCSLFSNFLMSFRYQFYKDKSELCLYNASRLKKTVWDEVLLVALKEKIPWEYLQKEKSLKMTLKTLRECKKYICWTELKSIDFFWDEDAISEFREYLFYIYTPYGRRIKAERLSDLTNVSWSVELINEYYDYWDWIKLSSNPSVKWDEELIEYYYKEVDFTALCKNKAIKWDSKLLNKFLNQVNWKEISARQDLQWTFEYLIEFENYLYWSPKYPEYKEYLWPLSVRRLSLSENPSILWNSSMLHRWQDKVDFFLIARYSKMTIEVLIEFKEKFFQREKSNIEFHKWSDMRETADIYQTAWEVMSENKNIKLTSENVGIFNEVFIDVEYTEGNLVNHGSWVNKNCTVLEVLREKEIDDSITFEFIVGDSDNNNWVTKLLNEEFRNRELWERVIKPNLDRDFIKAILENLHSI